MLALALALAVCAQTPAPPTWSDLAPPLTEVLHDADEAGGLYAVGRHYKMIFDATGARYVPALGARAPRNTVLAFRVDGAAAATPRRDGDRVSFDRGTFVEVYDLALDHVEQSFVLRAPTGEAEWRVRVDTDAAYAGRGAHELRFDAQGLGTITYGDATIRDARGVMTSTTVRFEAGAIVIPLPADANDASRYPLVVDPLIQTIPIDDSGTKADNPDVAYNVGVNKFQVSYERRFSALDHDVYATRVDANGNVLETLAIDVSLNNSLFPRVASSGSHFMTTWFDRDDVGIFDTEATVRARARVAGSTAISAPFAVSGALQIEPSGAAVGGNANGTFLLAWNEQNLTGFRVLGRLATAGGPTAGKFEIDDTGNCENPEISDRPNASGRWLVAYSNSDSFDFDRFNIRARQVSTAGAVVGNASELTNFASGTALRAAVTTNGTNFLVAFDFGIGDGQRDVWIRPVTAGTNLGLGTLVNFSAAQLGAAASQRDQVEPALAFDGVRYAMAYTDKSIGLVGGDIRGATFFLTPSLILQESHVAIDTGITTDSEPRLAGCGFDIPGKHFVAWSRFEANGDLDAMGGVWSTLGTGGVEVFDTGCGGPAEPLLFTNCVPALGNTCNVLLLNFHAALLAFGSLNITQLCPNTACRMGLTGTTYLAAPSNTTFTFSIGNSPALVGSQLALQGMDFLVPANATETCLNGGQPVTMSDTLRFTIQ